MANFISPCGGLYFDDSSVKKIGNVITGASVDSVTNSFNFCGQSYDSAYMNESGAEYTVVCSKTGYVNNSQNITNNASDQTIDVVLNLA